MLIAEWLEPTEAEVAVYDLWGREQIRWRIRQGRERLDLSAWPPGIYLVEVDGRIVQKFVVYR